MAKPTNAEEEFFAREEAEKLYKLHKEALKKTTAKEAADQKQAHFMKCGKCGYDLQTVRWRNVDIERCFRCGVVLLDDGELEKLAGNELGFFSSFKGLFKP